jgi:hypothetical protein
MIAALYVDPRGCYAGLPWVDLWDEARDARRYEGPWPVVAHPPCGRWCRLAGLVAARYPDRPDLQPGRDGGTFAAALAAVRRWGGVLEHPAYSDAWAAHDLLSPVTGGGWTPADFGGGWTCYVEQHRYGHPAKKATWLYAVAPGLPSLRWGHTPDSASAAWVSWCGNRTTEARMVSRLYREEPRPGVTADKRRRLSKREASSTPPAFRDALLRIAASCSAPQLDGARTAPVAPDGSDPTPGSPGGETALEPALRGSDRYDRICHGKEW